MTTPASSNENPLPERAVVGRYSSARKAHEYGLVVLSQGAPYWIEQEGSEFQLLVEPDQAERVGRQLELYRQEQRFWPFRPLTFPDHPATWGAAGLWVGSLFAFFIAADSWGWAEVGRLSAADVMSDGAWWQTVTALTLHTDGSHFLSNALLGGALFYLLARGVGTGFACLLALAAGALGNALNAWFHFPSPHFSIGASTAVFGAVGCLAAIPLGNKLRKRQPTEKRAWLVPLLTGAALLGWFGAGGDGRTDVTAHLFGFIAGLPLGAAAGALAAVKPFGPKWQKVALLVSVFILFGAWNLALRP